MDPRGGGQAMTESLTHSVFKIFLLPEFSWFWQYPDLLQNGEQDGQSQSVLHEPKNKDNIKRL